VASAVVALGEFLLSGACPPAGLRGACAVATKLLKGEAVCQYVSEDADEWEEQEEKEVQKPGGCRSFPSLTAFARAGPSSGRGVGVS